MAGLAPGMGEIEILAPAHVPSSSGLFFSIVFMYRSKKYLNLKKKEHFHTMSILKIHFYLSLTKRLNKYNVYHPAQFIQASLLFKSKPTGVH